MHERFLPEGIAISSVYPALYTYTVSSATQISTHDRSQIARYLKP